MIDGTDGLFWFFVIVDFSSPLYIVGFVNRDEDIVRESFSVKFNLPSLVYVLVNLFFNVGF